ncbi:MAG: hypothetical protein J5732_02645 [Bacteroidaceae bacterium]|nr:hypothetical protein [Bacteroidaceae bacterium]
MKATKKMARIAKKNATIIALAAIAGTSATSVSKAERAAMRDMAQEYGRDRVIADYTWDPFDGLCA